VVIYPQPQQVWQAESRLTVLPQMWNHWMDELPLLSTLDQGKGKVNEVKGKGSVAEQATEQATEQAREQGRGAATARSNQIPPVRSQNALPASSALSLFVRNPLQVVLPLMHQGMVMGLLVAGRHDREWQTPELSQLKNIAETLAIACLLDRRQIWYEQQLLQQRALRHLDRDRMDDLLHQLRNQLTALKTFSKLLLKQFLGDEKGGTIARSILRESDRLQDLLVQYENEQAGEEIPEAPLTLETTLLPLPPVALAPSPSLVLEEVDLPSLLEPILLSAEAIAQEKEIRLLYSAIPALPRVWANTSGLREVLTNLITNAIKYTPPQGEVIVVLGLQKEQAGEDWLGIEVRDSGYGIPAADCDRIFERHYRGVQATGEIPGTGLGLAIVKELVDQMQGQIEVTSPNPYLGDSAYPGSCFTLWLTRWETKNRSDSVNL
jgi:signal transduction histidine kinase